MSPGFKSVFSLIFAFLAVWLGVKLLLPLFSPFLLGLGLALAAEPMVGFLHKKLHIPRSVSAGLGVSMAFCFLAILLLLLCAFLVRELKALGGALPALENAAISGLSLAKGKLLEVVDKTPPAIRSLLRENTLAFFSDSTTLLGKIAGWCLSLAGSLLNIKPVIALENGEIIMCGKARGSKNANNLLASLIAKDGIDFSKPCYLAYSGLSDTLLQKYVADSAHLYEGRAADFPVVSIGSTIGTHAGPGAIAVAFFAKN